jgi:hypothetical protein
MRRVPARIYAAERPADLWAFEALAHIAARESGGGSEAPRCCETTVGWAREFEMESNGRPRCALVRRLIACCAALNRRPENTRVMHSEEAAVSGTLPANCQMRISGVLISLFFRSFRLI